MSNLTFAAAKPETFDGLAGWAVGIMDAVGGPGAAIVVGADNLFPPIPSELVLPLAGFSASQGAFSFGAALFWTTLGSVLGAIVVYALGALIGRERTRKLVVLIPLIKVSDFDRSEAWFAKHGSKAVLLGRMVPLFRSFISLPAGIDRMGLVKFVLLTTIGSLIWNTIFVTAGYQLGENWHRVDDYAGILQKIIVVSIALVLAGFVVVRWRAHTARSN